MIQINKTNIFNTQAEAIVNPVNCVGVMGAGLALAFKRKYPDMFTYYRKLCRKKEINLGDVNLYRILDKNSNLRYIFLFPTKLHWTHNSKLIDIVNGMRNLRIIVNRYNIKSIAIPALGCGLGGLKWVDVLPVIVQECRNMENCEVEIYEPR
jgi:O-acetyl-ADP-ribose deacetylase (regulator of RNase III)